MPGDLLAHAPVFAALGDETRLRLVLRLSAKGRLSITELAEGAPVTRQGVTKHLRVLETAGLARSQKKGREQQWELAPERLAEVRGYLKQIEQEWEHRLEDLKAYLGE